jgi:hypothetical protein
MNHNRREFLERSAKLGAGVLSAEFLSGGLRAIPNGPQTQSGGESVCPKSAHPAETLFALRIQNLDTVSYDEPYQNQLDERLPLTCLQGLVNREKPRLFLVYDRYDELWLDWLKERGDVKEVRWVDTEQLYEEFLPVAKGLVVTDPNLPASVNVATMLAGVEGLLPVTPRLLPLFSLKVAQDLRGKWKKDIEAYRWFYSEYGSQLSRRACAYLDPGVFELRDYFVEFKVPIVWVSSAEDAERSRTASPEEEAQFARDLFSKLPANIPCLGWMDHGQAGQEGIGEDPGVTLASQYGKFEVCSGWDGWAHPVSNLSVHSGTFATFHQKTLPPPALSNKIYWTYTRTDGDGPNFWRHVYRHLWSQRDHGKVPVGWQTGPTAYDLIPDVLDYFYKHATDNDVFVNALTGIGYIHEAHFAEKLPESQQEAVWEQYMELSKRYFRLFDFSLLTTYEEMPLKTLERFTELPGIKGIFANYARSDKTTLENETSEVRGIPVFRAIARGGGPLDTRTGIHRAVASVVADIRQFTPKKSPAFLHVSLSNWMVEMRSLVEIQKTLGPDYVLVRPDHLAALYMEAKKRG